MRRIAAVLGFAVLGTFASAPARAQLDGTTDGPAFTPMVPISAFARPAAWLDPSRLHVTASVLVGSTGGNGLEGLQLTRLSYQFGAPLAMSVSLGNAFGANAARSGSGVFLEGLGVRYQPFRNFMINVAYQNFRSRLQLSPADRYSLFHDWR